MKIAPLVDDFVFRPRSLSSCNTCRHFVIAPLKKTGLVSRETLLLSNNVEKDATLGQCKFDALLCFAIRRNPYYII